MRDKPAYEPAFRSGWALVEVSAGIYPADLEGLTPGIQTPRDLLPGVPRYRYSDGAILLRHCIIDFKIGA